MVIASYRGCSANPPLDRSIAQGQGRANRGNFPIIGPHNKLFRAVYFARSLVAVPLECSFVMSVYNEKAEYLRSAVASILAQSVANVELILIDDGSTETSCIEELDSCAKLDSRIRLIRNSHSGLSNSLNYGVDLARSSVILRHDSDDWSSPERASVLLEVMKKRPALVLLGSSWSAHMADSTPLWDVKMPSYHQNICRKFWTENPFCHGSVAFKRDAFLAVGGYSAQFIRSQDYDLFWRLSEQGEVDNVSEVLYHRRFCENGISGKDPTGQLVATRVARRLAACRAAGEIADIGALFEETRAALTISDIADCHLRKADNILLSGDSRGALALFFEAAIKRFNCRALLKLFRAYLFIFIPPLRRKLYVSES